jgi:hypothetical protein
MNDNISDISDQSNKNALDIAQMKLDINLNIKPSINANTTEINNIK